LPNTKLYGKSICKYMAPFNSLEIIFNQFSSRSSNANGSFLFISFMNKA